MSRLNDILVHVEENYDGVDNALDEIKDLIRDAYEAGKEDAEPKIVNNEPAHVTHNHFHYHGAHYGSVPSIPAPNTPYVPTYPIITHTC